MLRSREEGLNFPGRNSHYFVEQGRLLGSMVSQKFSNTLAQVRGIIGISRYHLERKFRITTTCPLDENIIHKGEGANKRPPGNR